MNEFMHFLIEFLTIGISFGALFISWKCIKRTMDAEVKKAIILRKLDYAERSLVDLKVSVEDASALLLVIRGNLSDEYLEMVRQSLNQGIEKYAKLQLQMRSNLMLANLYFNFIKPIEIGNSFEKIKQIFVKSREWGDVETMTHEEREELRSYILEVGNIIEKDLNHYNEMYSTLSRKFNKFSDVEI